MELIYGYDFSLILTIVSVVWFVNCLFWEGMIFEKVGDYLEEHLPYWLFKPSIGCVICMTPYWGTLISVILFGDWYWLQIIMATGLNAIITRWMND